MGLRSGASKGRQEQGPAVGAAHSGSGGVCMPSPASVGVHGAHIQHTCATCHVSCQGAFRILRDSLAGVV